MIQIISLILGALAPRVGDLISIFSKKVDHKQQIELMKLAHELKLEEKQFGALVETSNSIIADRESARRMDTGIVGQSPFFDKMRASIVPIFTYLFAILFFSLKFILIYNMVMVQGIDLLVTARAVLDEETTMFFTSIMSFWFGSSSFVQGYIDKIIKK